MSRWWNQNDLEQCVDPKLESTSSDSRAVEGKSDLIYELKNDGDPTGVPK